MPELTAIAWGTSVRVAKAVSNSRSFGPSEMRGAEDGGYSFDLGLGDVGG